MEGKSLLVLRVAGGIVALLLQVAVAPFISLGQCTPNFIVAWCAACCIANPAKPPYLSAFLLGMAFDIAGGGPVGAMAFCLLVVTFAASRVYMVVSNDTVFMTVAFLLASVLMVEMLYGFLLASVQPSLPLGQALLYRSLPNSLYNFVVAAIVYPIVAFLQNRLASAGAEMPVI